jgi:hypothetical protein
VSWLSKPSTSCLPLLLRSSPLRPSCSTSRLLGPGGVHPRAQAAGRSGGPAAAALGAQSGAGRLPAALRAAAAGAGALRSDRHTGLAVCGLDALEQECLGVTVRGRFVFLDVYLCVYLGFCCPPSVIWFLVLGAWAELLPTMAHCRGSAVGAANWIASTVCPLCRMACTQRQCLPRTGIGSVFSRFASLPTVKRLG